MKSISVTNFEKFENHQTLNLNDITILVGANNSGKSTFVKVLGQMWFNVKNFHLKKFGSYDSALGGRTPRYPGNHRILDNLCMPTFSLANIDCNFPKIGTYRRAKNINSETNEIVLSCVYDTPWMLRLGYSPLSGLYEGQTSNPSYEVSLTLIPASDNTIDGLDKNSAYVSKIYIVDKIRNFEYLIDFKEQLMRLDINDEKSSVHVSTHLCDYLTAENGMTTNYVISSYMLNFLLYEKYMTPDSPDWSENEKKNVEAIKSIFKLVESSIADFERTINYEELAYIRAHSVPQKIIYTTDDKNDYIAETLCKFTYNNVDSNNLAKDFIMKWMREFGIGVNYRIDSHQGEAFELMVNVVEDKMVPFADLGIGARQILLLLFNLALYIQEVDDNSDGSRIQEKDDAFSRPFCAPDKVTIAIEEPEQNLHPAFQSKLAELFTYLLKKYAFKFLIETHSEYIIRKIQVLVKSKKIDPSSINISYFDEDGIRKIDLDEDGILQDDFGKGFYDEAAKLSIQLY